MINFLNGKIFLKANKLLPFTIYIFLYFGLFSFIYNLIGPWVIGGFFGIIIYSGLLFGISGGIAAPILCTITGYILFFLIGEFYSFKELFFTFISFLIIGFLSGYLGNFLRKLHLQNNILLKQTEEKEIISKELKDQEDQFKRVLDSLMDVIFQIDIDGNIKYLNNAWEKLTNFTVSESINTEFSKFLKAKDQNRFSINFNKLLSKEIFSFNDVYQLKLKSGELKWIDVNLKLLFDGSNNVIGLNGSLRDITDIKNYQETLRYKADFEDLITIISTTFINLEINNIDKGIISALQLIGQFIDSDRSYVFNISKTEDFIYNTHEWCNSGIKSNKEFLNSFQISNFPWIRKKLINFESIYISSISNLPLDAQSEKDILSKLNIPSLALVPMIFSNDLIGCIGFDFLRNQEPLSSQAIQLLSITSDIFANAIVRKNREEELISLNKELELRVELRTSELKKTVIQLNGEIRQRQIVEEGLKFRIFRLQMLKTLYEKFELSKDLHTIYEFLYDFLPTYPKVSRASLLLYDKESNNLVSDEFIGIKRDIGGFKPSSQPLNTSISGRCFLESKVIQVDDCLNSDIIPEEFVKIYNLKSVIAIPIIFKNRTMGVLRIDNTDEINAFNEDDVDFFSIVSNLLGIVIENIKLFNEKLKIVDDLKESESRYKLLFENNPNPIIVFDVHTLKILNCNNTLLMKYGYSKNELLNKSFYELHPKEEYEELQKWFETKRLNDDIRNNEWRHILKNGTLILVETLSHSIIYDNIKARIVIITDITERKENEEKIQRFINELQLSKTTIEKNILDLSLLNEKLVESEIQLKELNDSKDKFFSILSHDLRSPFNAVVGLSDLLSSDIDNLSKEEIKRFANGINRSATNLVQLLNNVLEWSRLQSGKLLQYPQIINVDDTINYLINVLFANALKKSITLEKEIEPNLFVFADKNSLTSILQNLITNSIKFSNFNGQIIIRACRYGLDYIKFEVEDNGVGISDENISNLFRIDVNYSTKGTNNEEGTGLGLVLCKELIEKNSGNIYVESIPNKKTIFSFTLPSH